MKLAILVLCSFIATCYADRVKDPLSDHDHFAKDGEHDHDSNYDHDAFLGKDVAKEYDELTPEESKEKLGDLFHKVDADSDNFVTADELKKWMKQTQNRYIMEDTNTQMKHIDADKDGYVTWDEYQKNTFGDTEKNEENGDQDDTAKMMARDEKRFKRADDDGGLPDMKLKLEELSAFLHPESHDHMKGFVVDEAIEDMDKDKDGSVSMDEYLGDMYPAEHHVGEKEPEWLEHERTMFREERDQNKDGRLDMEEVKKWIMPDQDGDMAGGMDSEVQHLMSEADTDKDGKISKEEMVEKHDVFVGSQVTDYGDMFKSPPTDHIEL